MNIAYGRQNQKAILSLATRSRFSGGNLSEAYSILKKNCFCAIEITECINNNANHHTATSKKEKDKEK